MTTMGRDEGAAHAARAGAVPTAGVRGARTARSADAVPGTIVDGELVPDWLGTADVPWLRELLLQARAFDGEPFASLASAWRRSDVPPRAGARWRPVLATLRTLLVPRDARRPLAVVARTLRATVFAAVANGSSRADALAAGAAACGLSPPEVEAALFADVEAPLRVRWPAGLDADGLRRAANGRFAAALLATASQVRLVLHGASRAVLRTAWLHGASFQLAATPVVRGRELAADLRWQPTAGDAMAGRRLASVLPVLPWARRFELRAACRWRGERATLVLSSLDALPVGAAPAPFDSRLEADVADALVRTFAARGGELVREPAPVPCGEQLAFPDFVLTVPGAPSAWWLEVAGLRDPSALPGKLQLLARLPNYLLCVPRRHCPEALAAQPRVVSFARGQRGIAEIVAGVQRLVAATDAQA
jgi:hypothetical protein